MLQYLSDVKIIKLFAQKKALSILGFPVALTFFAYGHLLRVKS